MLPSPKETLELRNNVVQKLRYQVRLKCAHLSCCEAIVAQLAPIMNTKVEIRTLDRRVNGSLLSQQQPDVHQQIRNIWYAAYTTRAFCNISHVRHFEKTSEFHDGKPFSHAYVYAIAYATTALRDSGQRAITMRKLGQR